MTSEKGIPGSTAAAPTPDPPKTPYTAFSNAQCIHILAIVTSAAFLAPLSGNIYLPAMPLLAQEFKQSIVLINFTISVFMLVFAIGPLFWGSLADFMGRKPLYSISIMIFVLANIALAATPSEYSALICLRIVQATGACSVASLGAGTIADVFEPRLRGRAISYFMLGPQIGPILGPIFGGAIAGGAGYRWIFGFLAILGSVVSLWMLFCLPETLRSRVGNATIYKDRPWVSWPRFCDKAPIEAGTLVPKRPNAMNVFRLLKYPPIILVATNSAILFGSYYCVAVTLPQFLVSIYGFSEVQVGCSYIAPGAAMVIGSIASGRYSDYLRAKSVEDGQSPAPELRIRTQILGVALFPVGVLMYGWFCHFKIHVATVLVSTFIIGFSMAWVFATNTTYLTECKPGQVATLVALNSLFRNPAAAVAAVIIEPLVGRMGIGWCFLGLGIVNLGCCVIVVTLIIWGPHWRKEIQA